MWKRIVTILVLSASLSAGIAAANQHTQTTKSPSSQDVRTKLGPDLQFLLTTPPPSGGKISPGDALTLRSLCGTCTPDRTNPWSTIVKTRSDGTSVTLADLYQMHRGGAGWGEISQRQLGVKLGPQVREVANDHPSKTPSAQAPSQAPPGWSSDSSRGFGGGHGFGGSSAGIGSSPGMGSGGHGRGK